MTETSSSFNPRPLNHTPSVAALASHALPLSNGVRPDSNTQEEEEYTIKCICGYTDDDGNTVYCEKCDTWQHIECYYHGKIVPEEHFCADCDRSQKDLDARRAKERQRRAREHLDGGDQKAKRPASKTSKKKQKEIVTHELTNGWNNHERSESVSNGKDQPPPAKKPKTSHRTSGSIVSLNGEPRKRALSNVQSYPSPSKSPQDLYRFPCVPLYTTEFLELYDHDTGNTAAGLNEYTLHAANHLSRWRTDPDLVVVDGKQPNMRSPFVSTRQDLDHIQWPKISLETQKNTAIDCDGKNPTWKYLRLQQPVAKDTLVGEICGQMGMLEEYCQQSSLPNRWNELAHPDPFVFFHPHMNIYIDSRLKGTQFRYLRRSCQPNVTLKTFVPEKPGDSGDARHCFVANQDIPAGSELTAAWYVNPAMFDVKADREDVEQQENQRCDWVSKLLANFGDCACDRTQCPFGRLDRRSLIKATEGPAKQIVGRKRKAKGKQAVSPTSTGQATNSRAGSEAINGVHEDDQEDRRSSTESSRSGQRSRDITPVNVAVLDADPVLGTGLTARELKKIQAVENAFKKKEQTASGVKKKKRRSGGSMLNTPNPNDSTQQGSSPIETDSKGFFKSPPPPLLLKDSSNKVVRTTQPSSLPRPKYVSQGTQTHPSDVQYRMPARFKNFRYITPTQRILNKIKQDRDVYYQKSETYKPTTELESCSGQDLVMKDAGSEMSPMSTSSESIQSPMISPTATKPNNSADTTIYPLPSQAAHTQTSFKPPPVPRLHLSTLPPVPAFPNGAVVTPGSTGSTPASITPSGTQLTQTSGPLTTPLATMSSQVVTPSPVKKKLSLGDYMSRRHQTTTPASEKTQAQSMGDISLINDGEMSRKSSAAESYGNAEVNGEISEVFVDGVTQRAHEGHTTIDDLDKEEEEAEYSPPGASPLDSGPSQPEQFTQSQPIMTLPTTGNVSPDVANVLARLAQFQQPAHRSSSQPTSSST